MPTTKSAAKRMRQSVRNRSDNRAAVSAVMTARKHLYEAVAAGDRSAAEKLLAAYFAHLDKAAKHGALKTNAADRKKSRATLHIRRSMKPAAE